MTPDEYICRLRDMVSSGRDQEALAFAREHDADVSPLLTLGQHVWVADTLHMAATLVGMDEHAAQQATTRAHRQPPRGATSPARGAPAAPPR